MLLLRCEACGRILGMLWVAIVRVISSSYVVVVVVVINISSVPLVAPSDDIYIFVVTAAIGSAALDVGSSDLILNPKVKNKQVNRYKGSCGNEKLLGHWIPTVGIVQKVP